MNNQFEGKLQFPKYDPANIQFDCLKATIDSFEAKHGRFSDYGFSYIKFLARACEIAKTEEIISVMDSIEVKIIKSIWGMIICKVI